MDSLNSDFGRIVRKIRQTKGHSIKSLAPKLDVTYSYLSKIENGHTIPSEDFIGKLADFLGHDKEELMLKAGKIPEDVLRILRENPKEAVQFLRREFSG